MAAARKAPTSRVELARLAKSRGQETDLEEFYDNVVTVRIVDFNGMINIVSGILNTRQRNMNNECLSENCHGTK